MLKKSVRKLQKCAVLKFVLFRNGKRPMWLLLQQKSCLRLCFENTYKVRLL